jgi:hypothetical protein
MKKIILVSIILILAISLSGCLEAKFLRADVVIEHWHQSYNEKLEEWSDSIQVWYKIFNTGNTRISYYKVWFTIFCEDGSSYQDWSSGLYLDVGDFKFRTCLLEIGEDKRVTSVEATDWELEYWNYPIQ